MKNTIKRTELIKLIKEVYTKDRTQSSLKSLENKIRSEIIRVREFHEYMPKECTAKIMDFIMEFIEKQTVSEDISIDSETAKKNPDLLNIINQKKIKANITNKTAGGISENDSNSDESDYIDSYEKEEEKAKKDVNSSEKLKDKEPKSSELKSSNSLEKNKENYLKVTKTIKQIGEKYKNTTDADEKNKLKAESQKLVKLRNDIQKKLGI